MQTTCATCGKTVTRTPACLRPGANFCSRRCHYQSHKPRPGRKTGSVHVCAVCGKEFYVPRCRPMARFCGRACKGVASRLPKKACAVCGKEFQPHFGCGHRPCCSRECGDRYRTRGALKNCEACGTAFYRPKASQARFCSKACCKRWQGRNKVSHTCVMCGKVSRWSPSRLKVSNVRYCSITCRNADPACRERLIQMNVRQQQGQQTTPERIGYALLTSLGIPHQPQHLIGGKFCVDAFLPDAGVVVQFDGDYWHGHPERFPAPDARQRHRMKLDRSQDSYMAACGYRVVRLWEHDLKHNLPAVRERLLPFAVPPARKPAALP